MELPLRLAENNRESAERTHSRSPLFFSRFLLQHIPRGSVRKLSRALLAKFGAEVKGIICIWTTACRVSVSFLPSICERAPNRDLYIQRSRSSKLNSKCVEACQIFPGINFQLVLLSWRGLMGFVGTYCIMLRTQKNIRMRALLLCSAKNV